MRAATGSQWSSMSSGVTCALFGWLNTRLPEVSVIDLRAVNTHVHTYTVNTTPPTHKPPHTHSHPLTHTHPHTHTPTHTQPPHMPTHVSLSLIPSLLSLFLSLSHSLSVCCSIHPLSFSLSRSEEHTSE